MLLATAADVYSASEITRDARTAGHRARSLANVRSAPTKKRRGIAAHALVFPGLKSHILILGHRRSG